MTDAPDGGEPGRADAETDAGAEAPPVADAADAPETAADDSSDGVTEADREPEPDVELGKDPEPVADATEAAEADVDEPDEQDEPDAPAAEEADTKEEPDGAAEPVVPAEPVEAAELIEPVTPADDVPPAPTQPRFTPPAYQPPPQPDPPQPDPPPSDAADEPRFAPSVDVTPGPGYATGAVPLGEIEGGWEAVHRRRRRQTLTFLAGLAAVLVVGFVAWLTYAGVVPWPFGGKVDLAQNLCTHSKPLAPKKITVRVYNGSNREGLAGQVAAQLKALGFVIKETGNDPLEARLKTPIEVRHGENGDVAAATTSAYLVGKVRDVQDDRQDQSVDVVLGPSFTRVHTRSELAKSLAAVTATLPLTCPPGATPPPTETPAASASGTPRPSTRPSTRPTPKATATPKH